MVGHTSRGYGPISFGAGSSGFRSAADVRFGRDDPARVDNRDCVARSHVSALGRDPAADRRPLEASGYASSSSLCAVLEFVDHGAHQIQ